MYWNIDRIMKLIIGIVIAAVLVWLVRYLSDVLLPFFVACFVAYLLQPVEAFNRRITRTRRRVLSSVMTVVELTAVIALLVYFFLPSVIKETGMLDRIVTEISEGKRLYRNIASA